VLAERQLGLAQGAGWVHEVGSDPFREALVVKFMVAHLELTGFLTLFNRVEADAAGQVTVSLSLLCRSVELEDAFRYNTSEDEWLVSILRHLTATRFLDNP